MSSGGKGAKSAKVPDYSALAVQQGNINRQTAQELTAANRPNQYDALGNSITWTGGSVTPAARRAALDKITQQHLAAKASGDYGEEVRTYKIIHGGGDFGAVAEPWAQHQNLSPENLAAWQKYNADANRATSQYGELLNKYLGGYTDARGYNDPEFSGQGVADALYGSVMDRLRPEQQRDTAGLDTQLRQQGLIPGTEAYNRSMQNLMRSQGDVTALAGQQATLAGGQEGRARYQSYLSGRNQPLQELSGMAGIAGGSPYTPSYTGFSSATGYNPTDLIGAAQATYAAKQSGANAKNSKKGGLLGAGASIAGSYLGGK